MAGKTFALCALALLQLNSVFAAPVELELPEPILRRQNDSITPSQNITPIITEIADMTEQELQDLIDSVKSEVGDLISRSDNIAAEEPRGLVRRAQGTEGALLTFIDGDVLPGTDDTCTDFELNGPFTSIHALMGSSNFRGITATSYTGNTTEIQSGDTVVDAGEFKFADNERITKFTIGRSNVATSKAIVSISFETDAGNSYSAVSGQFGNGGATAVTEELDVGSGILARIRGTKCQSILGSIGFDILDQLDSISITNIDYSGFTNNIMPSGEGTQLSMGSQVLDNRNSSVQQTISLLTTDTVTQSRTITTDIHVSVGGSVSVSGGAGIPFISEGKVTAETNWAIDTTTVSSI